MKFSFRKFRKRLLWTFLTVLVIGFLIPENMAMPVQGATSADYNPESFWYYPWGKSGTHKGVDVFASTGTPIHSATSGIVVYQGDISRGGKVVLVLGPKWRLHYYAHLDQVSCERFDFVNHQSQIGTVGTSGNAAGKAPHLHYSIFTPIPYLWRIDGAPQGWKKMFYLDPIKKLEE